MADTARRRLKQEILYVLRNSDEMLRAFRSQIENKNVIIFIGNTRNGKSTLVNYITDAPLVAFQEGNLFKIEHQNGSNVGPTIGHGTLSHTTAPTVIEMESRPDTVIVDAPGFDDNRGPLQEIINALYINQIKYSKGVRFVLVSDINNIINDNINYFLSFIETVHTIMPDFLKLKEAVSIIFTKDWKSYDHVDIVKLLRSKILDVDGLRCNKTLIEHFVEREDLIGLFKMPSAVGALTEEISVNVRGAIFESLPVNLSETDIRFGISKSARIILLETYLEFFDVIISLRETFSTFRVSAAKKFLYLTRKKILDLPVEQLHGEINAEEILLQLHRRIKCGKEQLLSVTQVPDSLQELYVEEVTKATNLIEGIGIQMPKESDPVYSLNTIEEMRRQLEYIACIEKVVEKNSSSENILALYKQCTDIYHQQIEVLQKDIHKEVNHRTGLTSQIRAVSKMETRLREADEQYLSDSFHNELLHMKRNLEEYIATSDSMLRDIRERPPLQRQLTQEINQTYCIQNTIENKIKTIDKLLETSNNAVIMKYFPPSITGFMGTIMLYASITYFRSLSECAQLTLVGSSFLLFAAFSWKSAYMRTTFSRIRRRYQQKRFFTRRTKFDGCCHELLNAYSIYHH